MAELCALQDEVKVRLRELETPRPNETCEVAA